MKIERATKPERTQTSYMLCQDLLTIHMKNVIRISFDSTAYKYKHGKVFSFELEFSVLLAM